MARLRNHHNLCRDDVGTDAACPELSRRVRPGGPAVSAATPTAPQIYVGTAAPACPAALWGEQVAHGCRAAERRKNSVHGASRGGKNQKKNASPVGATEQATSLTPGALPPKIRRYPQPHVTNNLYWDCKRDKTVHRGRNLSDGVSAKLNSGRPSALFFSQLTPYYGRFCLQLLANQYFADRIAPVSNISRLLSIFYWIRYEKKLAACSCGAAFIRRFAARQLSRLSPRNLSTMVRGGYPARSTNLTTSRSAQRPSYPSPSGSPRNAQCPPSAVSMYVMCGLRKIRSRVSGRIRMNGSFAA